jgi:type IV pilus assembly protein PilC
MKYSYRAFDRAGKESRGTVEASAPEQVHEQLRGKGLFVAEVSAEGAGRSGERPGGIDQGRSNGGSQLRDLSGFARQLSVLVGSGTPLVEALHAVERQASDSGFRAVIGNVRSRVEEGSSLSEAMAAHPGVFDAVCRSLVVAGEAGGKLDEMLSSLADLLRQQVRARSQILGAMVYPVLLIGVAIVVLVAMVGFVLPRFEGLFKTLDTPLPPTTKVLMQAGGVIREWWYLVLPGAAALVMLARQWARSRPGRKVLAGVLLDLPRLGAVARSMICARIVRLLGVLMQGRVPMLEALGLVRESTTNWRYAELIGRAEDAVTRGESLASVFENSPLITPAVAEAFRSGERSGRIGPVLLHVADYLDEDNEVVLKSVSSIIEPVILLVLGVLVGGVALSMFLPLFDLASAGSQGPGGAP